MNGGQIASLTKEGRSPAYQVFQLRRGEFSTQIGASLFPVTRGCESDGIGTENERIHQVWLDVDVCALVGRHGLTAARTEVVMAVLRRLSTQCSPVDA